MTLQEWIKNTRQREDYICTCNDLRLALAMIEALDVYLPHEIIEAAYRRACEKVGVKL
jgi:hypothetical protein